MAWAAAWQLDGDLCRCRKCKRAIIVTRMDETFHHAAGCAQAHLIAPWQDLRSRIPASPVFLEEVERQKAAALSDVERWKKNFIPFAAMHASSYGRELYGEGCLHYTHFDMLEEAGARMDDFVRCGDSPANSGIKPA